MIEYQTIVIAAAIGIIPVFAWLFFALKKGHSLFSDPNLLLKIFFWGVLTAIPAGIFEIAVAETKSDSELVMAIKKIWAQQGASLALVLPSLIVALIEEFSKGLGIIISMKSAKLRAASDGIILGMITGLAFAVTENGVYFANAMKTQDASALISVVILRFLFSSSSHLVYSGIVGLFLAKAKFAYGWGAKILNLSTGFIVAVLIHMTFNSLLGSGYGWVVVLIVVFGLFGLWWLYHSNSDEVELANYQ